jgi:uncharacterized membrane protein
MPRRRSRKSFDSKHLRQLKKTFLFLIFINVIGLTMPIIYNRIKEIDMTFFCLLFAACLIGLVGAEVMNAR